MTEASSYAAAVEALRGSLRFGVNPSLDGIRALTEAMGRPQGQLRVVQVAGTNGKTSVARMTAALLSAHGRTTGAYTSPHLHEYVERVEVEGEPVSRDAFALAVSAALAAADGGVFTEFELVTAAGLWLFRELGVEWACLEAGMGGRWDATSVTEPEVAVVTGIGLDHVEHLGTTLAEIAGEKAQIVKPGSRAVFGPLPPEAADVFRDRLKETGAQAVHAHDGDVRILEVSPIPCFTTTFDVTSPRSAYPGLRLSAPSYQARNAFIAILAAEAALDAPLRHEQVSAALDAMRFPGRFEPVSTDPLVIADGAHNPQAAETLAEAVRDAFSTADAPACVLGVLDDKDVRGIAAALVPVVSEVVATASASERSLPPERLAQAVSPVFGKRVRTAASVAEAIELLAAMGRDILVTGSITTAAEARLWAQSRGAGGGS